MSKHVSFLCMSKGCNGTLSAGQVLMGAGGSLTDTVAFLGCTKCEKTHRYSSVSKKRKTIHTLTNYKEKAILMTTRDLTLNQIMKAFRDKKTVPSLKVTQKMIS